MANLDESRVFREFNDSLRAQGPLEGIDDYTKRLPPFSAKRITNCGKVHPEGFGYDEKIEKAGFERFGIRPGELNVRMGYRGFLSYWNRSGENTILTRISSPSNNDDSLLIEGTQALKYLAEMFHTKYTLDKGSDSKLSLGKVIVSDRDFVLSVQPVRGGDKVTGDFAPWWESYWYGVMRPVLAVVNHYKTHHKIDMAILLEDFPALDTPE